MLSLFDMLANAQNGNAIDQMAKQFNLSQQQTQQAIEALLPAFSQGLKRNAANPYDLGSFLTALSSGQHAQYFENATRAFSPDGVSEGNGILGHLFGSKELSRTIAAQASQITGIGQDTLKQMLPVLATMIMGGLFKQTSGQMPQSNAASQAGNPLQQIIEQMMKQGGYGQPQSQPQQQGNPFENPFGKMLEGMFGGSTAQPSSSNKPSSPTFDNPLGRIFEEMLGGGGRQAPTQQTPEPTPSGRERTPYDDLFGDMFESGRQTRDTYQKNMETIFDQFLNGMKKQ